MTRERPILFSGPMVRAILSGTKTQTRRVVKPSACIGGWEVGCNRRGDVTSAWPLGRNLKPNKCPYGQPGDRLWVRETFQRFTEDGAIIYKADPKSFEEMNDLKQDECLEARWRPSIHMPRWASRITLEITGVRVERLQDINEEDARAEGARECDPVSGREVLLAGPSQRGSFILHYRDIWEQINGHGSWEANPWVWVVKFQRVTP